MRALIVGAGAVGQVYGHHLQRGGAEISFYVKPRHAEEARKGFTLYPPGKAPLRIDGAGVLTTPEEVAAARWDQVWLCVASPALKGPEIPALLSSIGKAVLVCNQPGLEDRAFLLGWVPQERLVNGIIMFMAWAEPLPGEKRGPGVGFWYPPFSPNRFSGADAAVEPVIATLRRGGGGARRVKDASYSSALGSAVLLTTVAALEVSGWSLSAWRGSETCRLGVAAAREALAIAAAYYGEKPGMLPSFLSPGLLGLVSRVAAAAAPMDFEAFLRVHFLKVGSQTRAAFETWRARGEAEGLPTTALSELSARFPTLLG